MTGLVRKATLLTVAGLLAASAAMAGVPSAANSTVPACISLVGSSAGVPDAFGSFSVTVRDLANNPLNGASVVVDLSGCTDIAICDDQLDVDALVNCAAKTTRKFTDALNGAAIYANGTLIGSPTAAAYDLDGQLGLGANDLSAFLGDFASAINYGRSDFDCDGTLGANDLSAWLTLFGGGTSTSSCAVSCP